MKSFGELYESAKNDWPQGDGNPIIEIRDQIILNIMCGMFGDMCHSFEHLLNDHKADGGHGLPENTRVAELEAKLADENRKVCNLHRSLRAVDDRIDIQREEIKKLKVELLDSRRGWTAYDSNMAYMSKREAQSIHGEEVANKKIEDLQESRRELTDRLHGFTNQVYTLEQNLEGARATIERYKSGNIEISAIIVAQRDCIAELEAEKEKRRHRDSCGTMATPDDNLRGELKRARKVLADLEQCHEGLQRQVEKMRTGNRVLTQTNEKLRNRPASLKAADNTITELRQLLAEAQGTTLYKPDREPYDKIKTDRDTLRILERKLKAGLESNEDILKIVRDERDDLRRQLKNSQDQTGVVREERDKQIRKKESAETTLASIRSALNLHIDLLVEEKKVHAHTQIRLNIATQVEPLPDEPTMSKIFTIRSQSRRDFWHPDYMDCAISELEKFRIFAKSYTFADAHGCVTGDCPHNKANECVTALSTELEEIAKRATELTEETK